MSAEHIIIIVSALGGIIGGMGMGGGTLLIPLLTLTAGIEQHLAQAINLIAFIPMSAVALLVHRKNGYVEYKKGAGIAAVALIGAAVGSIFASYAEGYALRASYGAFLIALGAVGAVKVARNIFKKFKAKRKADLKAQA